MLKKIWQSCVRWLRKLFKKGAVRPIDRVTTAELPPLDDTDREYLFMQLLEGVAHGWQQPRAISFFNKVRQRVRKSEWLEWLDKFGNNLIQAPVPNYELAGRMVQLAELDCGEIGDLAGEYGVKLLNRQAAEFSGNLLPIMEFEAMDAVAEQFPEIPLELLIDRDPMASPPSQSFATQSDAENPQTETREITLEEFSAMLHKDPDLVAELAEQFGVETTDPQEIVNIVIAQMQQQVPPVSGDLSATADVTPAPTPTTTELPTPNSQPLTPNPQTSRSTPPPPPAPKLEYKQEDPWHGAASNSEELHSETVNTPDRGV
jgi:hypothetical protein